MQVDLITSPGRQIRRDTAQDRGRGRGNGRGGGRRGHGRGRGLANPNVLNFDLNQAAPMLDLNQEPDLEGECDNLVNDTLPVQGDVGLRPPRGRARGRGQARGARGGRGELENSEGRLPRGSGEVRGLGRGRPLLENGNAPTSRGHGHGRGAGRGRQQLQDFEGPPERGRGRARARGRPRGSGRGRGLGRGDTLPTLTGSADSPNSSRDLGASPPTGWQAPEIHPDIRSPHSLRRRRPRPNGTPTYSPGSRERVRFGREEDNGTRMQEFSPNSLLGHHRQRHRLSQER